jgi:hypothetical protein
VEGCKRINMKRDNGRMYKEDKNEMGQRKDVRGKEQKGGAEGCKRI